MVHPHETSPPPTKEELITGTVGILESALLGVQLSTADVRTDPLRFYPEDMRRLFPRLPDLAEYAIAEALRGQSKLSVIGRVIDNALDKVSPKRVRQPEAEVSEPFLAHYREVSRKIDESMASTEVSIYERAYEGQVTVNKEVYQFDPTQPVYTLTSDRHIDYGPGTRQLWYELAPSSGYVAEVTPDQSRRGHDEPVLASKLEFHLAQIEAAAKAAAGQK